MFGWQYGVGLAAVAFAAATPALAGTEASVDLAAEALAWLTRHVQAILGQAYERAPALVVALAALLIVPLTALVALLAHALRIGWFRRRAHTTTGSPQTFKATATPAGPERAAWPQTAWLDIEGQDRAPLPRAQGLVRIGRHEDNDIRLPHSTVHRHHALIHRTPAAEFVIMDLSGQEGNGVVINGRRRAEAQLASGDTIQIGDVRLRFECAPL